MQKQKSFQFAVIGVLAFAVLFMSVGFATYSQVLDINGTNTLSENVFSVALNSDSFQEGEGSVEATTKTISDSEVSFGAHLAKPGDYYLFSIDVENLGNSNAVLDSVWMSEQSEEEGKLLDFTVVYDNDDTFTGSASDLNFAITKNVGNNRKNIVIKVTYNPGQDNEIPADGVDFDYTVKFDFVQAI